MEINMNPETTLPHNDGTKTERIDLGLAVLASVAPPQTALSPADIAAWCDCTPAMITGIEARALRRLRERVREHFKISDFDMADSRRFLESHFQP
jgi:hypothetical protein